MGSLDKLGSRRSSTESQSGSEREVGLRERRQVLRAGPESRTHTTAQQSMLGCHRRWKSNLEAQAQSRPAHYQESSGRAVLGQTDSHQLRLPHRQRLEGLGCHPPRKQAAWVFIPNSPKARAKDTPMGLGRNDGRALVGQPKETGESPPWARAQDPQLFRPGAHIAGIIPWRMQMPV